MNVGGVEVVSRSPNAPYPKNVVNSVQLSRPVSISRCSYSFSANIVVSLASDTLFCGQFRVNEAPTSSITRRYITSAVQQDLIPSSRVMPLDADKLQQELCFHLDQRKVDL